MKSETVSVVRRWTVGLLALAGSFLLLTGGHLPTVAANTLTPPTPQQKQFGTPGCTANSSNRGVNGTSGVIRLTGAEARADMEQVIAKDPALAASLAKDTERFARIGAKPTGRWTVVHVSPKRDGEIRPVQNGQVWADGNTIAWYSYDDGNNSTWKGTVYLADTVTGQNGTWAQQTDVSRADNLMQPQWTVNTYWHEASKRGPASWSGDLGETFHLSPVFGLKHLPLIKAPNWMGFYGCATGWCAGAATGCMLFAGPGAPACFASGCTGAIIGCSYGTLWGQ